MTPLAVYVTVVLPLIAIAMALGAKWLVRSDYRRLEERAASRRKL